MKIEFGSTSYKLTVTQGDQVDENQMDNGYIGGLSSPLDGNMAFIMSNWGSDDGISWLQHGACSGTCDNMPNLAFSNLSFTSGGSGPAPGD